MAERSFSGIPLLLEHQDFVGSLEKIVVEALLGKIVELKLMELMLSCQELH